MSSPGQAEEDEMEEVEFVSEGPLRPVLECIDLLSDSEDEGCSSMTSTLEEKLSHHKDHVTSTLDRLAQQVAFDKQERANKCRAFKEKQILQKAHGQQELAFSSTNGINQEAKRCVDMWLKMPGVKPGVINAGCGRRRTLSSFPKNTSTRYTCPVINCRRVYENPSLLDGHLKRFDHSPCDPTIHLKGSPSEIFACVACGLHFQTKEAWKTHLESKVSSSNSEGHSITQNYQVIACFACPACYLLFNLRDECLQHMSAQNHFKDSLIMTESKGRPLPIPVPQYAKNRLIALCKDAAFNVRCSLCHKVLISHQAAQAHFNVQCREGCAVAKAEKTVVHAMKQLQVRGQCTLCSMIFHSHADMQKHKESTQHKVEVNQTMEKALLQYSRFNEMHHNRRAKEAQEKRKSAGIEDTFLKRNSRTGDLEPFPAKRQRLSPSVNGGTGRYSAVAWFCECGLQFSEEDTATKHLLAVNQIFHQCGVCGKHMGESSVARLHMSRFHGGAHLSNFLYYCRKCKVEMPRREDILLHISEAHRGHTYFTEQQVQEDAAAFDDAKPSTSGKFTPHSQPEVTAQQSSAEVSSSRQEQSWMCRMCEDIFETEEAVHKHCSDMSSHSFQRFICGHCPQKFFKESTVRRHCMNEHNGQIKSSHFCGLCDSMQFESEGEFIDHYKSLHSRDYCCMDAADIVQPALTESPSLDICSCMSSEKSKAEMKTTYTQCMKNLAAEGKCQYICTLCSLTVPSYAEIKTHVHTKHTASNLDKPFHVECKVCREIFTHVPSFHKHHHSQHCIKEPCVGSRTCKRDVIAEPSAVKILDAMEVKPDTNEIEDETLMKFFNMEKNREGEDNENESDEEMKRVLAMSVEDARESAELEEALKRSLVEY
ncbi:E3 SUMO-protein ligase ZNF451 [Sphaeramia orbicularis]|uniref:C2H2-type domain-containing protein n=1 Tax=Sphaeramia orbicularis TaxID=375764 RepID=A0A673BJL0_9TELE|nr:E3 SUMO-protein ligase ZNF451 [Sphaeramia orbicularis]XP_030011608.1 E3 SUMO-protein ligase ZNF451 [Sphaeramia orbicularis]